MEEMPMGRFDRSFDRIRLPTDGLRAATSTFSTRPRVSNSRSRTAGCK